MAAVAPSIPAVDLRAPSSYPIRLGASILKPAESIAHSTVRYNYKPRTKAQGPSSASITAAGEDTAELSLHDGSDEYGYTGRTLQDASRYVLITKGSGKEKELVLERLGLSHEFNLTSTSFEHDVSKLAERYQQLPLEDEDGDGLFGDEEGADEPVDENNPFDFRNHLKPQTADARPSGADTPQSAAGTPRPSARPPTSKPPAQAKVPVAASAAAQKKRKGANPLKPNPKRVKAGTEPPPPRAPPKSKPQDLPSVRLDRKTSLRRPSFDDSGELILENETPATEKPPRAPGSMALALSGQFGQAPISLRSAASSPASRDASPLPPRPEDSDSPAEFDLGEDSSPEVSGGHKATKVQSPGDYFGGAGEEDEEEADADVEDLELPSPRQGRKSVAPSALSGGGGGDEDYDMERELELALMADDGGTAAPSGMVHESDEESEEE